jgi:hypothetical protein
MAKSTPDKIVAAVTIHMRNHAAMIEKLSPSGETGQADIRISARMNRGSQTEALTVTEDQLIELLFKASHAGVLSQGFIGKLRRKIEI